MLFDVPLNTIGAADSFNAGFVYALVKNNVSIDNIHNLPEEIWGKLIQTAIAFSSEVCMSYENYVSWEFAEELQ